MKRFLSLALALMMVLSLVPASAEGVEYIPAPYTVAEGAKVTDTYLEPKVYTNGEGEPTISTTLLGVLKVDGKYFKDLDNDKELDVFEDWRETAETRTTALLAALTKEQKAQFIFNNLFNNPASSKLDAVKNEDGTINVGKVISIHDPNAKASGGSGSGAFGMSMAGVTDVTIIEDGLRHGVYRSGTSTDASVVSLYNNVANTLTEYAAVTSGNPVTPYTLISNPIATGYVNYMALAAAVMGDIGSAENVDDLSKYAIITEYASLDREMWVAMGIRQMYGPQIDLASDPRWVRNSTTYGEVPEVVAGITKALVEAYQVGSNGVNTESVALSIKHFPGDGSAENGYESHSYQGQWRIYSTPGSLEKYQLVGFQAACDAGVGSIMPCYSRDTADPRSAEQTYRGVVIPADMVGSAYSHTMMQTLLTEAMGFKGFINTDSGILTGQTFGVEELELYERYAKLINNGVGAIGADFNVAEVLQALEEGLITMEALDKAVGSRIQSEIAMGRFDNPYTDPANADAVRAQNTQGEGVADKVYLSQLKSVVLLKNKGNVLPLKDAGKKVYIASFTGKGEDDKVLTSLTNLFEAKGFTVVDDAEDADIAYLDVQPTYNGAQGSNTTMGQLDLVEGEDMPELFTQSQLYNGEKIDVTTLEDVKDIAKIAKEVHGNGGVVIASIKVTQSWILTNLEPHCDGLIAHFGVAEQPQIDVITGAYNPTGKMPITLVSSQEVVAVNFERLEDNVVYQICVSPNDVPGYDKDQYIDPAILAEVPGGSYAYCDSEGNYYRAWFGLSY